VAPFKKRRTSPVSPSSPTVPHAAWGALLIAYGTGIGC